MLKGGVPDADHDRLRRTQRACRMAWNRREWQNRWCGSLDDAARASLWDAAESGLGLFWDSTAGQAPTAWMQSPVRYPDAESI